MKAALLLLLFAVAGDPEPVKVDGRTWVWSEPHGMYRPAGIGWQYSKERGTWWRGEDKPRNDWSWPMPGPGEPLWKQDKQGRWWYADIPGLKWWVEGYPGSPAPPRQQPQFQSPIMAAVGGASC